jgi:hypothetical protein
MSVSTPSSREAVEPDPCRTCKPLNLLDANWAVLLLSTSRLIRIGCEQFKLYRWYLPCCTLRLAFSVKIHRKVFAQEIYGTRNSEVV